MLHLMPKKPTPTPDPSAAEVRLAIEKIFAGLPERLSPEKGIRLMQDRIAELKQNIAGWNCILDTDPANEAAQKCLAADQTDLQVAEARLQECQLQAESRN